MLAMETCTSAHDRNTDLCTNIFAGSSISFIKILFALVSFGGSRSIAAGALISKHIFFPSLKQN